jgi:L-ascorbate metabolism protein UlaG (beta-lactamase superfamily)
MTALDITFLRTSMLLLEFEGSAILTDPWFGMIMRIVPVFRRPGIALDRLPRLDGIVASHCHPDHFERAAVDRLAHPDLVVVGTRGVSAYCRGLTARAVHDVGPWETATIGPFRLTATPAVHTNPPPAEVNFMIEAGPHRVFFGGDARFSQAHSEVADRLPRPDVALLPIGGTLIFGHRTTMGPSDAVRAANVLRPRFVIPIHEGGEWMPMPPASWHPGRNHHFVRELKASGLPIAPCVLAPGETARLTAEGLVRRRHPAAR